MARESSSKVFTLALSRYGVPPLVFTDLRETGIKVYRLHAVMLHPFTGKEDGFGIEIICRLQIALGEHEKDTSIVEQMLTAKVMQHAASKLDGVKFPVEHLVLSSLDEVAFRVHRSIGAYDNLPYVSHVPGIVGSIQMAAADLPAGVYVEELQLR